MYEAIWSEVINHVRIKKRVVQNAKTIFAVFEWGHFGHAFLLSVNYEMTITSLRSYIIRIYVQQGHWLAHCESVIAMEKKAHYLALSLDGFIQ